MNNLVVKEVDFNGDTLMACEKDEKIYVGVKWVCQGIGLSEGQIKSERKKIQEDIVLKQGGRNFVLPTNSGKQDVLCIELEFLPLWLAKISITPKMQKR
ncbi:phage antirepressor N-terminal domain-containing protein [Lysinibacillus sp. FSL K6-0102]|uniref:phage antirepressor N-terminal domain-containing protein n=1 Tax=Lysinibacillus sp. FSL K6-0102 TaxID=2975290 RepID=UPI0030F630CE